MRIFFMILGILESLGLEVQVDLQREAARNRIGVSRGAGLLGVEDLDAVPDGQVLAHDLEVDRLQAERLAQTRRAEVVVEAQLLQTQVAGVALPEGRGLRVVGVVAVGEAREAGVGVLRGQVARVLGGRPAVGLVVGQFEHVALVTLVEGNVSVEVRTVRASVEEVVVARTLEQHVERPVLVAHLGAEAVHELRNARIGEQGHPVVVGDDAVAVYVLVLDVSRTDRAELFGRHVHVLLVLEQAQRDESALHVVREARLAQVGIGLRGLLPVVDLVFREGEVASQREVGVLAQGLEVLEVAVAAPAGHAADVAVGHGDDAHVVGDLGPLLEDALAAVAEVVDPW